MNGGGPEELLAHGRVLVVEDDEQTAELMRRSLQRAGYRVEIADCVQAGLDALRSAGQADLGIARAETALAGDE